MNIQQLSFKTIVLFANLLVVVAVSSCKKSTDTTPSTNTASSSSNAVTIQNTAFNSNSITVAVNTSVTWTNKDGFAHTVTSTTGLFDSNQIAPGGNYSHQFTSVGTFQYHCLNHSTMTGTVIVK